METEGMRISPLDDSDIHAGISLLGNTRMPSISSTFEVCAPC